MSQSFLRFPLAIVTRDDADYVDSLATLSEEVVTVPKAFTSHQFLKQNYPHLQVILTDTIEESMALVSSGKAIFFFLIFLWRFITSIAGLQILKYQVLQSLNFNIIC